MDLLGNMFDVRPLLPPLLLQSPLSLSSSSYLSHIPHEGKLVCINEALQLHPDGHVHVILHRQVDVSIENPTCTCICMGLDINFITYRDYVGQ